MELSRNWITDPVLDAEYKRYKLLAFLQFVEQHYSERRLFPYKGQVQDQSESLVLFLENLQRFKANFPKLLKGFHQQDLRPIYQPLFNSGLEMEEVEKIIVEALPLLNKNLFQAEELIGELKRHIEAYAIGVLPLQIHFGYLMLEQGRYTDVYEYEFRLVKGNMGQSNLSTTYLGNWRSSLASSFENIKLELVESKAGIANPATFGFTSCTALPTTETYLPLAKEMALDLIDQHYGDQNTLSAGEK